MIGERPWLPGLIDDGEVSAHVPTIAGARSRFLPTVPTAPQLPSDQGGVSPSLRMYVMAERCMSVGRGTAQSLSLLSVEAWPGC